MENFQPGFWALFNANPPVKLTLVLEKVHLSGMSTLLQRHCFVKVRTGASLRQLLCDQFSLDREYVEREIKVIFLNFHPVDDIDGARIRDGATLALSAAMPGLVGAAMGRDGLPGMRGSITYRESDAPAVEGDGVIELKLFNRVMADWGPHFLRQGVYIESAIVTEYLTKKPIAFWQGCREFSLDGDMLPAGEGLTRLSSLNGWVALRAIEAKGRGSRAGR